MTGAIVIAAGGTGGHFFPAEALATELAARGHELVLMTDARGRRGQGVFAAGVQHVLPGSGIAGGGVARKLRGALALGRGTLAARDILARLRPAAVVGFGGYPSVPPLLGARLLRQQRPSHRGARERQRPPDEVVVVSGDTSVGLRQRRGSRLTHVPADRRGRRWRRHVEALRELSVGLGASPDRVEERGGAGFRGRLHTQLTQGEFVAVLRF